MGVMNESNIIHKPITVWQIYLMKAFRCHVQNCWIGPKRFLSKFCIPLQFHERYLLCTFLAQKIYTLLKRSTLKWKFLRLWSDGSKFVKFVMSIWKSQFNSSSNFASFFITMTYNPSMDFKLILFLLWIKGSNQNPNFEILKCSGENLLYSSCHFPNHKSVFLQILHHPSLSWKITPLYYLDQKLSTIGANESASFGDLRVFRWKFTKFLSFLKQKISFSSNFASIFRVTRYNFSVFLS